MVPRSISRAVARLGKFSDRRWYLPLVSFLAAVDLFVAVIPTDGILITSVLLRPKRWISTFVWVALGSAFGAFVLALLVQWYGEPLAHYLIHDAMTSPSWESVETFMDRYGSLALFLMSFGPLPQQPAVTLCALAHMPLAEIVFAVVAGRGLKYGVLAWSATHAPRIFERWKSVRTEVQQIQEAAVKGKQP